ncbi:methylglyoxal synthase [uncultured Thiothrix sp.]|uniref:methylglyoxal synthase n=1 Tax=uncultured Thiothrix sp. TaxID=223185 RepID=UPI00261683ED|nr:methylglyoxal synthase [uncultured Thiothrix sp.]HMT92784.1 methylglyoxal synthase [Thiolinea sp.]
MPNLAIAMIAHDRTKPDLVAWVGKNLAHLQGRLIYATGTTGRLLQHAYPELTIHPLKSGPLGGDQQVGALIAEGKIGCVIFLQDPMTPQPHDVDVKALVRLATLYEIPLACNQSTADYLISSRYFTQPELAPDILSIEERYEAYLQRLNASLAN